MLLCFMHFIKYLYVYCYAWVKGELQWSLTLIHAYITPWVLSSSKRGRLLAQRPFNLVLMMINSWSYSLLIILGYLVSDIWSNISRWLASTKVFFEFSHVDSRARASCSHLALGWSQARWIAFGSSRLGDKKTSVCV